MKKYILLENSIAEIAEYNGKADALDIPASVGGYAVSAIGDEAFAHNPFLSAVTIPDCVASVGFNPFRECDQMKRISVSPDHPALAMIEGVLFEKAEKVQVCDPSAFSAESYAIPQGILAIGDQPFAGCDDLTAVTMSDSLTSTGDKEFSYCAENLILTVEQNSFAAEYAQENRIPFIISRCQCQAVQMT